MSAFSPSAKAYEMSRVFYFLRHGWIKLRNRALELKDAFTEFHAGIWKDAAAELSVDLESFPGGFYRISHEGRWTWIQDYLVELDHLVTVQVARNKPLVNRILSEHGLPVPPFLEFTLKDLGSARDFLARQQAPCVVKPALESAGGRGVTTHVRTRRDLRRAALFASTFGPRVMIERQVAGDVYRLLYLDGLLIDAIRRRPPHVVGDGRSSVRQLIKAENGLRVERTGRSALKVLSIDFDCRMTLRRAGRSLGSVPEKGEVVLIKSTTNESGAQECEAVRRGIGPDLVREGARAAEALGVRLAGVDVITPDAGVSLVQSGGVIIEINAAPGLHYHYQVRNPEEGVAVAVPILRRLLGIDAPRDLPAVPPDNR